MSQLPNKSFDPHFMYEEYLDPQTNQTILLKKIIKYERIEEADQICEIKEDIDAEAAEQPNDEIRDDEYIDIDQLPNIQQKQQPQQQTKQQTQQKLTQHPQQQFYNDSIGYAVQPQPYTNQALIPNSGYAVPQQYQQFPGMPPNQIAYSHQQGQSFMRQQGQQFLQPTQLNNQPQQYTNQYFQQQYIPQQQQIMQQQQLLTQSTPGYSGVPMMNSSAGFAPVPNYQAQSAQHLPEQRNLLPKSPTISNLQQQQRQTPPQLQQQRNNSPLYQQIQQQMIRPPQPIVSQQFHPPPQSQALSKLQRLQEQQQQQQMLHQLQRQQHQQPVNPSQSQHHNHQPNQYPQPQQQPQPPQPQQPQQQPIMMSYNPNQYRMYPMQYVQHPGQPPQYAYGHVPPQMNKASSTIVSPHQLQYSQMMPLSNAAVRTIDGRPVTISNTVLNQLIQTNSMQSLPNTSHQSNIQHFQIPFNENNLSADPLNRISKINLQSNVPTVEKRVKRRRRRQEELLADEDAEDWKPPVKQKKCHDRSPSLSSSAETSYTSDSSMSSLPLSYLLTPNQVAPKTRFFLMKKYKHLVKDCCVRLRRLSRKDVLVLKASLKLSHPVSLTEGEHYDRLPLHQTCAESDFLNITDPTNTTSPAPVFSGPGNPDVASTPNFQVPDPHPIPTGDISLNDSSTHDDSFEPEPLVLEQPDFLDTTPIPVVNEPLFVEESLNCVSTINEVVKDAGALNIVISTTQTADTTAAIQSMLKATPKRKPGRPWKNPPLAVSPSSVVPSVNQQTPGVTSTPKKSFEQIRSTLHSIERNKQISSVLEHRKLLQQNRLPSRPASAASSVYASCDSLTSLSSMDTINNRDSQQGIIKRSFAGPKSKKAEHCLKNAARNMAGPKSKKAAYLAESSTNVAPASQVEVAPVPKSVAKYIAGPKSKKSAKDLTNVTTTADPATPARSNDAASSVSTPSKHDDDWWPVMPKSEQTNNEKLVKSCSIALKRMSDNDVCAVKNQSKLKTSKKPVSSSAVNTVDVKVSDQKKPVFTTTKADADSTTSNLASTTADTMPQNMVDMRTRLNDLFQLTKLRKLQSPAVTKQLLAIEKASMLVNVTALNDIAQNKKIAHDGQVQSSLKSLLEERNIQRSAKTKRIANTVAKPQSSTTAVINKQNEAKERQEKEHLFEVKRVQTEKEKQEREEKRIQVTKFKNHAVMRMKKLKEQAAKEQSRKEELRLHEEKEERYREEKRLLDEKQKQRELEEKERNREEKIKEKVRLQDEKEREEQQKELVLQAKKSIEHIRLQDEKEREEQQKERDLLEKKRKKEVRLQYQEQLNELVLQAEKSREEKRLQDEKEREAQQKERDLLAAKRREEVPLQYQKQLEEQLKELVLRAEKSRENEQLHDERDLLEEKGKDEVRLQDEKKREEQQKERELLEKTRKEEVRLQDEKEREEQQAQEQEQEKCDLLEVRRKQEEGDRLLKHKATTDKEKQKPNQSPIQISNPLSDDFQELEESSCCPQKELDKQQPKKKCLMSFETQQRLKHKLENLSIALTEKDKDATEQEKLEQRQDGGNRLEEKTSTRQAKKCEVVEKVQIDDQPLEEQKDTNETEERKLENLSIALTEKDKDAIEQEKLEQRQDGGNRLEEKTSTGQAKECEVVEKVQRDEQPLEEQKDTNNTEKRKLENLSIGLTEKDKDVTEQEETSTGQAKESEVVEKVQKDDQPLEEQKGTNETEKKLECEVTKNDQNLQGKRDEKKQPLLEQKDKKEGKEVLLQQQRKREERDRNDRKLREKARLARTQLHFLPRTHTPPQYTFHATDCVIEMANIPYFATNQDIINFFRPLILTTNQVVRQNNECGQLTDKARVCFRTPADARFAFYNNNKQIYNRIIFLKWL